MGKTHGVKKLINPAPNAKANFNNHVYFIFAFNLTAITILAHDNKIYWFSIYSALVLFFHKTQSFLKKDQDF